MKNVTRGTIALLAGMAALAGCESTQQQLASGDEAAKAAALNRGKFELNCPGATATVLSSEMLQPVLWRGRERAEYSIGVSGCGKQATYVVICPESDECLAGSGVNDVTTRN